MSLSNIIYSKQIWFKRCQHTLAPHPHNETEAATAEIKTAQRRLIASLRIPIAKAPQEAGREW
jgi:hypothetical protein